MQDLALLIFAVALLTWVILHWEAPTPFTHKPDTLEDLEEEAPEVRQ